MPYLVNLNISQCKCAFGAIIAPLIPMVPNCPTVTVANNTIATVNDLPMPRPGLFGVCNSVSNPAAVAAKATGASVPCTFIAAGTWIPGSPKIQVGGKLALTDSSKISCALGGPMCVSISKSGVTTVQA